MNKPRFPKTKLSHAQKMAKKQDDAAKKASAAVKSGLNSWSRSIDRVKNINKDVIDMLSYLKEENTGSVNRFARDYTGYTELRDEHTDLLVDALLKYQQLVRSFERFY
jgi:hypothetical protein